MRYITQKLWVGIVGIVLVCATIGLHTGKSVEEARITSCGDSRQCLTQLILEHAHTRGIRSLFDLVRTIDTRVPAFRSDCHAVMLSVVGSLYEQYPDLTGLDVGAEMATCNYAFLQQYPQSILLATKDITRAKQFCENVGRSIGTSVPGAQAECYRGIGRGLPLIAPGPHRTQETMAAFGLRECKDIATNESDHMTCVSAVFNIIGRSAVAGEYGLSVRANDPMYLCELQDDPFARARCFGNYKATVVLSMHLNDPRSIKEEIDRFYEKNASSSVQPVLWSVGYEWARTKLVTGVEFTTVIDGCRALGGAYIAPCIQGASVGLAKHGIPGNQHVLMTSFCFAARRSITSLVLSDCPSQQAVGYIKGFYSPAAFRAAYQYMRLVLGNVVSADDIQDTGY